MDTSIDLPNQVRSLEGLECWGIVAGEGTGSRVVLDFGKKIKRPKPLKNLKVSETARQFKGEYSIFVQDCSWRLSADKLICSSKSQNDNDGEMVSGLNLLAGQRVLRVSIASNTYDLAVEFSEGYTLWLFCDCFDQESDGNNYSFHTTSNVFVVAARGFLREEPVLPGAAT